MSGHHKRKLVHSQVAIEPVGAHPENARRVAEVVSSGRHLRAGGDGQSGGLLSRQGHEVEGPKRVNSTLSEFVGRKRSLAIEKITEGEHVVRHHGSEVIE